MLYTGAPPSGQLPIAGLHVRDADSTIDDQKTTREAVEELRGGKVPGICNIRVELLKAGGQLLA